MVDCESSGNLFTAGRRMGYAVKDAIQVALDYVPLSVNVDAPVGAYGHNEGAIATGASTKFPNLPSSLIISLG